jgi:hypothetical protein
MRYKAGIEVGGILIVGKPRSADDAKRSNGMELLERNPHLPVSYGDGDWLSFGADPFFSTAELKERGLDTLNVSPRVVRFEHASFGPRVA